MSKNSRRAYRTGPQYRTFGDKQYDFWRRHNDKVSAQKEATEIRQEGYLVRVVKERGYAGWMIFVYNFYH